MKSGFRHFQSVLVGILDTIRIFSERINRALNDPRRPLLGGGGGGWLEAYLLGEGVGAFAVGALLRFNLEAHLLDDGTAYEAPHAVRLPAGRGHDVLQRCSHGTVEEFENRGLLAALACPLSPTGGFLAPFGLPGRLGLGGAPCAGACASRVPRAKTR